MQDLYIYEVDLEWNESTLGTLNSPIISNKIEVATPPEFKNGIKDKWTPEHLFVAAVNACLMSTFILISDNSKYEFISYKSNAIAKVEKVEGKYLITEITIKPFLIIPSTQSIARGQHILELSEKACTIANSIKCKITLEPEINIKPD